MTEYLIAKWLHILFSTLLFGTGIGTAFYLFFVSHTRNVAAIAVVSRFVVIADWWFTATTIGRNWVRSSPKVSGACSRSRDVAGGMWNAAWSTPRLHSITLTSLQTRSRTT